MTRSIRRLRRFLWRSGTKLTYSWRWSSRFGKSRKRSGGLIPAPDHGDAGRQAAAHVEGQIFFRALDLARPGLLGELLVSFHDLTNPCRTNRVTIADQATTRVHGNFEVELAAHLFVPPLR